MKVTNKYFDMLNFKGGIIMLCQNCNKNEATVKYTEIINGEKREVMLCEECSRELGIGHMNFNMPIDFSSFFGDLLEGYEDNSFMPLLTANKQLKCNNCNMSFDEFMEQGKFGCEKCYDAFSPKIDSILKRIQGSNRYAGRKLVGNKESKIEFEEKPEKKETEKEKLQRELKEAIEKENYEEAAKIRDKIKELKEE